MATKVEFEGATGARLSALLDLPDGDIKGFGLFAHCFTCSKNYRVIHVIAKQLAKEGIALLRFDFTGLGESGGEFADTTFATNTRDLVAAANFLATEYEAPKLLAGHSLGGAAVLNAAHMVPSAKAVAVIGAPCSPEHVIRNLIGPALLSGGDSPSPFRSDETGRAGEGHLEVSIGGRPFRISREFIDDLDQHDMEQRIANLGRPLMVFHSPVDTIVGVENAACIFEAARHPKSFVSLDTADHLVSDARDAEFLGHVLSAWAGYYLR
ncbi:MAG: alpha/beta hydrolase [Armatimonadetes bacterium]|nr:alpha/beta hydrolase [Armatimonadota bacterium]